MIELVHIELLQKTASIREKVDYWWYDIVFELDVKPSRSVNGQYRSVKGQYPVSANSKFYIRKKSIYRTWVENKSLCCDSRWHIWHINRLFANNEWIIG
jgi:hypothetical protein